MIELTLPTRLTSKEWQRILPNAVVVDPDGWDRQNFDYAWNVERITKREYKIRLAQSTCRWFLIYAEEAYRS